MDALLLNIVNQFQLDGKTVSCEPFGCGHVNKTYLVTTETGHRYTLQRIGPAFKDVHALQENISAIVEHLHKKTADFYGALTLLPTVTGEDHFHAPDGGTWRVYEFIEGGMVAVNSVVCEKATHTVSDGDRITVRTKGKFFIDSGDTLSKKGRIILKYSRYV